MVSFSHLSAGNSISSPSRDLFAKFGVSCPSSPVIDESAMAESSVVPTVAAAIVSDSSEASEANSLAEASLGLHEGTSMKEIFRAAQALSQQGNLDAADERRKSSFLFDFIKAKGFTMQNVNDFYNKGKSVRSVNDHDMFEKSPLKPPLAASSSPALGQCGAVHKPILVGIASDFEEGECLGPADFAVPFGGIAPVIAITECIPEAKTWSKVVAQAAPSLKLDFFPPSPLARKMGQS